MFECRISAEATEKLPYSENLSISSWSSDMEGNAKKCVERYCDFAKKTTQQLYNVSTPCLDDHYFKEAEMKSVGELSKVCSQIVLKCLYLGHVLDDPIFYGQWTHLHDLSQNVPKHVTNDDLVWSLTFIIHVITNNIVMWETLPNNADWALLQDSDLAGDLEDSKSTSGGTLCIFRKPHVCSNQLDV